MNTRKKPPNVSYELRQARIMQEFHKSGATIENLARAFASMEGKLKEFDAERDMSARDAIDGHYLGYCCETEEILQRATRYANAKKAS